MEPFDSNTRGEQQNSIDKLAPDRQPGTKLRSIGEDQHTAGAHEASEDTLIDALTILGKR